MATGAGRSCGSFPQDSGGGVRAADADPFVLCRRPGLTLKRIGRHLCARHGCALASRNLAGGLGPQVSRFRIMRGQDRQPRVPPAHLVDHGGGFPQVTPIILGVILLIIGFVAKVAIIWTLGIIVVIVGAILALPGMAGHSVGGRRHYY